MAAKVILLLQNTDLGRSQISAELGHKRISGELNKQIKRLLEMDLIERTIPDKPTSRLQKYRLTEKGRRLLGTYQNPGIMENSGFPGADLVATAA